MAMTRRRAALGGLLQGEELAHLATESPARGAVRAGARTTCDPQARTALGVDSLYAHQRAAWDAATRGEHVLVSTGTASGKTLAFNLPVLDAIAREPKTRALYLYPTKALAQDQFRTLSGYRCRGCDRRSTTATRRPSSAGRSAPGRT